MLSTNSKKAQMTLFIIIAIIIVAVVLLVFVVGKVSFTQVQEASEAENAFKECINVKTEDAIRIASFQGGWIYLPEFEAGSPFMPFSSYFNFLGTSVPYWFYVSGNGLKDYQVPDKLQIQDQLSTWLKQEIQDCEINIEGTEIEFSGEPLVYSKINSRSVDIEVVWPMRVTKQDTTSVVEKHNVNVKSNFGNMYEDAIRIFQNENSSLFLEEYSLDVLNLYAPTTRVELSCTPKIWTTEQVSQDIKEALSANIGMIKFNGGYYRLSNKDHKYFEVNVPVDNQVNLIYNPSWNTRLEVWPSENGIMKADPVGTQAGLGIIGFCYVSYHFVYDLAFPVLVQVTKENEVFQFPVIVLIDKNVAREAETENASIATYEICDHKAQTATVFTYDQNSNPVEADIYFKCINQICPIGKTRIEDGNAKLTTRFPECFTSLIIAKAEGYEDSFVQISSNEPFVQSMFLEKKYELEIDMDLQVNERAIITFESENKKFSVFYPHQDKVNLSEQGYDIDVKVFKETSLRLGTQTGQMCVNVPGGLGLPFLDKQECFDLEIPEQTVTEVVFGGGFTTKYFEESELKSSNKLEIKHEEFAIPTSIEELSAIYELLEIAELQVNLK
ncbi:MAG: hypothetical protein JSW08_01075 [archaeon]|nr:MAG: hypothetical protein JSW08_01075 [archaeon]